MGNIRTFDNPIDGLTPNDRATTSSATRGRVIEQDYSELGRELGRSVRDAGEAYDQVKTHQDISKGVADRAQITDNLTTAWDVTIKNADPNDHSVAEKFREEQLGPILDAWTSGFSTERSRTWAEEQAGQIRQHFFEKTASDQSTMAGAAVVNNIHAMKSGLSNTALQDPGSLTRLLGAADEGVKALLEADPNLTPTQVAQINGPLRDDIRKEIAQGAFIGLARNNPDAAMAALNEGKFKHLFDATTSNTMFGFAETIKREARADARAEDAMAKQRGQEDFNSRASALGFSLFQPDGSTVIPPGFHKALAELALHRYVEPGRIEALGNAARTAAEAKLNHTFTPTNTAAWQDLTSRIGTPDGSPNALTHTMVDQAYAAGKLSEHDWHFLSQAVEASRADPATTKAQQQLNQALDRVKPLVDKSNLYSGQLDQSGIQLFDDLHFDTWQKAQQLVATGKTWAEAVTILSDPRDPRGIQANLRPYQTNNKAGLKAIHDRVSSGGGPTNVKAPPLTTARKPGESAADYLKRVE